MSIKIYDGYIYDGTIKSFRKKCMKLLSIVKDYKKEKLKEMLKHEKFDTQEQFTEYRKQVKFIEDEIGFNFDITIFPIRNRLLVLIFTGKIYDKDIVNKVKESLMLKFYGYWNNVDEDENCTKIEWEQRKNDWTEALSLDEDIGDSRPAYLGFTISLQNGKAIDY